MVLHGFPQKYLCPTSLPPHMVFTAFSATIMPPIDDDCELRELSPSFRDNAPRSMFLCNLSVVQCSRPKKEGRYGMRLFGERHD